MFCLVGIQSTCSFSIEGSTLLPGVLSLAMVYLSTSQCTRRRISGNLSEQQEHRNRFLEPSGSSAAGG